jgi:CheY-like chemotaxis protein
LGSVFDRFRQADSTTTRSQGGLGIGLTIVRYIVETHGGTVAAHSAGLGQGSVFTVTLPMTPLSVPAASARARKPGAGEPAESSLKLSGKHILVVDDELDAREMLIEILRRCDADVTAVSSVREAFDSMARHMPDVLVSDIGMPEEDGFALIRSLRQLSDDRGGQTPAIALTAYAHQEDRVRILRAGFQVHLAKPIEPQQLISAIVRLAAKGDSGPDEAPAAPQVHAEH